MNKSNVLETITKLSRLTEKDSGAFLGEAANAASKIQELMDKYSITQEDLVLAQVEQSQREMDDAFESALSTRVMKKVLAWQWELARTIARATHTRHYVYCDHRGSRMSFFGRPDNVQIATSLYAEWLVTLDEMAKKAMDNHWKYLMKEYDYQGFLVAKKEGRVHGRFNDTLSVYERTGDFRVSWIVGCLHGMQAEMKKNEERRDGQQLSAITLFKGKVDEAYKEFSTGFKKIQSHVNTGSTKAYNAGFGTGAAIDLRAAKLND